MFFNVAKLPSKHRFTENTIKEIKSVTVKCTLPPNHKTYVHDAEVIEQPACFENKRHFSLKKSSTIVSYNSHRRKTKFHLAIINICKSYHTDVKFPKFEDVRLNNSNEGPHSYQNHKYMYASTLVFASCALIGVKSGARSFLDTMLPVEKYTCMSIVEYDLNKLAEGSMTIVKWGTKPLFVVHRTPEQIQESRNTPLSEFKDPEPDEVRAPVNPKYVVCVGICTHLGCIPEVGHGSFHGFLCNCHASVFDREGRIRDGPADKNLPIPKYKISEENMLLLE